MTYFVYILRCADGSLYVGITSNVSARLARHNQGRASRYTRGRLPVRLVYKEAASTRGAALKREYQIKQLTRKQKLALID